jgi:phosphoribosylformylglycinamidine (FGAM) synthase PurS component
MLEKYQRALTKEESQNISSNYSAKYFELNLKDQSSVQLFFEEVVKSICEDF